MPTIRNLRAPQDIEMGHAPLRDATQPLSDAPASPATHSTDTIAVPTSAGRLKKRLLAAAAVGGTLLGGGLVAAVAVPLLQQQRNQALALRNNALNALHGAQDSLRALAPAEDVEAWLEAALAPAPGDWVPSDDQDNVETDASSRPSILGHTSCTAPTFADEPSLQGIVTGTAPLSAPGPLYTGGLPRAGDQYRARRGDVLFTNFGSTIMLESLAAMHPQFLAGNLRSAGTDANGTRWFQSRVFKRPTALGQPTQAWIRASATTYSPVSADAPVWPLITNSAANSAFSMQDALQTPGDVNDNNDLERTAAETLSGSPIQSLALNRGALTVALRKGQFNESTNSQAALFQDKDDNIPFAVEMMRVNPMLFGSVQFSRMDFENLPQNVTTLEQGTVVRNLGNQTLSIEPQGKAAWTVSPADKGLNWFSEFAITGMHADGLDLRLATDAPENATRFLPYDALTYAGDTLNLGRVNCGQRQLLIA